MADSNLGFVVAKEVVHPMAIHRLKDGEFLICYHG